MNIIYRLANKLAREYRKYIHFGIGNLKLMKQGKLVCDLKEMWLYQPVYLYKEGGSYIMGEHVQFGYDIGGRCRNGYIELQARELDACIVIGSRVAFNNNCTLMSRKKITIGDHCRIGTEVQIIDFDGHGIQPSERHTKGNAAEIEIGENVWIGNRVTILPGTKIGTNCVVAAGAVVKGCFPDNVVIGGVPAKILKEIGDK